MKGSTSPIAETTSRSGESEPAGTESIGNAPGDIAKVQGQNWLLVPANDERANQTSAANKGIQFSVIFALVASVFAIGGAVALFINPRFDDLNQNINRLESKISVIEGRMTDLEGELTKLDAKLSAIGDMIILAFQDGELDSEAIKSIWRQASQ